jgi:hypothetical protein
VCEIQAKDRFLAEAWEKKAVLSRAHDARRQQVQGVMSMADLCSVLDDMEEKGACLKYGVDVCAMMYVEEERVDLRGDTWDAVERGEAEELAAQGATLQVRLRLSSERSAKSVCENVSARRSSPRMHAGAPAATLQRCTLEAVRSAGGAAGLPGGLQRVHHTPQRAGPCSALG